MMRLAAVILVAVGIGFALVSDAVHTAPALPFYDSADFSPRWTSSVDHRIDDFTLIAQDGKPLRRSDLLGRVHVATFIYTRCAGVCPAMVTQLKRVQRAIEKRSDALMVSYTVTPNVDTPEMLNRFGSERGIDPERWKLVTGDAAKIYALARTSYFADDTRLDDASSGAEEFLHTEKALLVDQEGRLRGVYNATVPHDIDKLIADLSVLGDQ
jgi:protein SCO1/2